MPSQPPKLAFRPNERFQYIAFSKPFQILCQFSKEPGSEKRTLAEFNFPKNVYSVGRLDFDSEGLLILTDDARLNDALLNPKNRHERTYLAQVERVPSAETLVRLAQGVLVEGRKTLPCRVELLEDLNVPDRDPPIRFRKNVPTAWLQLSLHEGKNRQVRKMTAAIGHPTLRLLRSSIGSLKLNELNLAPGQWTLLSNEQIALLFT